MRCRLRILNVLASDVSWKVRQTAAFFSVCCSFFPLPGLSSAGEAQTHWKSAVDAHVQPYLEEQLVVGLTIGIIQGDVRSVHSYGVADTTTGEPPNSQTGYEIGSITKVFTGLLLADLVSSGQLRLDQGMVSLLSRESPAPGESIKAITLRHLATHSSGLPRMPTNFRPADVQDPYADYDRDRLYAFLATHHREHPVETHWEYSNLASGLLGQLMADQQGQDFSSLLLQRICHPLSMLDTEIATPGSKPKRLATGHRSDLQPAHPWHFTALAGAGAIRSNMRDMMNFAQFQLTLHQPDQESDLTEQGAIDLRKAARLAWQIHRPAAAPDQFAMGLGWLVARDGQTRFHNGQTGGFHSAIFINQPLQQALILLSNTATEQIDRLAEDLFKVVAGRQVAPRKFER